ncbi:MAG: phosphate acyltransferase, partial [Bacteroidota bacterium]
MITKKGPFFFADTTMKLDPTAEQLFEITLLAANNIKQFGIVPRIALLSYTNFGSVPGPVPDKVKKAVSILHDKHPGLNVDGDMQANFALNNNLLKEQFGFSQLV